MKQTQVDKNLIAWEANLLEHADGIAGTIGASLDTIEHNKQKVRTLNIAVSSLWAEDKKVRHKLSLYREAQIAAEERRKLRKGIPPR